MFGSDRSEVSIYNELISKALAIASVEEVSDSSIKRILHKVYNPTVESVYNTFDNGHGIMSDGLDVSFPDISDSSYNILTNIVLTNRLVEIYSVIDKSSARFGNNKDSIFVYIDGKKVPDSSIWLYMTDSFTNVIIPKSFFSKLITNHDILIEVRKFDNYMYGGYRNRNFSGSTISFDISSHRNLDLNYKENYMVFCDGVYKGYIISSISYLNNNVIINLADILIGDIEVFIDSSIKYNISKHLTINNSNIIPFSVDGKLKDGTVIDPIYGPINIDNCLFFFNGLRISNSSLKHVGRLNFTYKLPNGEITNNTSLITTIFTDNGLIATEDEYMYGDDYFLYNFLGTEDVTNISVTGQGKNSTFNGFLNNGGYETVLSQYIIYDKVVNTISELDLIPDYTMKIIKLIKNFPNVLKYFLEIFASHPIIKTFYWDGITNPVIVGTDNTYPPGARIIRIISVNGKVAKIDKILVTTAPDYWMSKVDSKWFVKGDNVVSIIENVQTGDSSSYKVGRIERVETTVAPFYSYRAKLNVFGNIKSIDDFRVYAITNKKYDTSNNNLYFKDSNYGFRTVDGKECPRIIVDGIIYLDFGAVDPTGKFTENDPRIDMLIITTLKHHNVFSFSVDNMDTTYDSLFNELSIGTEQYYDDHQYHTVNIPLIHNGSMLVSTQSDGTHLFRDSDYYYRSQYDNKDIRNSGIILKRFIKYQEVINVVVLPEYTETVDYPSMSIEDTFDDKYGLLYLGNLKFPFSKKYVEVYANGKCILENGIDILSNKLIRLPYEKISLQNVQISAKFKASFKELRPFMELYTDSYFERNIANLFSSYNYFLPKGAAKVTKEFTNVLYETFDIGVDSNGKTPNPVRDPSEIFITPRYNLYVDAYLRWFVGDRSDKIWRSFKDIPKKVLRELEIFRSEEDGYGVIDSELWSPISNYTDGDHIIYNDEIYTSLKLNINCTPGTDETVWKLYRYDIEIYPYHQDLMYNIIIATKKEWYPGFTTVDTIKNFLECCVDNSISQSTAYEKYTDFVQSNRVYKHDLLPIQATILFDVGDPDIVMGRGIIKKFGE